MAIGDNTTFYCKSSVIVKWFFAHTTTEPVLEDALDISIYNVNSEMTGTYYCFGRYSRKNKHFLASAKLMLKRKLKKIMNLTITNIILLVL